MSTRALQVQTFTFTEHVAGPCRDCRRGFFLSIESIAYYRTSDPDATDAVIAADLDICLGCVTGVPVPGEYPLLETERVAESTPLDAMHILTTPKGYSEATALIAEQWTGTLTPSTIALNAPYPAEDAPAVPPIGKRYPVTSAESQTYIDTGEWPDAGALLPRRATDAEIAERLARATALLGEPGPTCCEGEEDAEGRACCDGLDIKRVTYIPYEEIDPCVALWCHDCRINAEMCLGHTIRQVEDAA